MTLVANRMSLSITFGGEDWKIGDNVNVLYLLYIYMLSPKYV